MDNRAFTPQMAADPKLPPALQAQIAQNRPDLRPSLAANPALYPQLQQWLANLGDPRITAALNAASAARANPKPPTPLAPPPPAQPGQPNRLPAVSANSPQHTPPPGQPATPPPAAGPPAGQPTPAGQPSAPAAAAAGAPASGQPLVPNAAAEADKADGADVSAAAFQPAPPGAPPGFGAHPQQPQQMAQPGQRMPLGHGTRGPRQRAWWQKPIVTIPVVLALVLTLGGIGWAAFSYLGRGGGLFAAKGASSPEELKDTLITAIEQKDILTLAGLLAPSETTYVEQFTKMLQESGSGSSSSSSSSGDGNPVDAKATEYLTEALAAVTVKAEGVQGTVENKSERLSLLSFTAGKFIISWDKAKIEGIVQKATADGTAPSELTAALRRNSAYQSGEITIFSEKATSNEIVGTKNGYQPLKEHEQYWGTKKQNLVLVQEDGKWFLSPILSYVDTIFIPPSPNFQANYAAEWWKPTGNATSGTSAVEQVVNGIKQADLTQVEANTTLSFRRAYQIYGQHDFTDPSSDFNFTFGTQTHEHGLTVVPIKEFVPPDRRVTYQNGCFSFSKTDFNTMEEKPEEACLREYFTDSTDFQIVVVEEDGYWRVDPALSVLNAASYRPSSEFMSSYLEWKIAKMPWIPNNSLADRAVSGLFALSVLGRDMHLRVIGHFVCFFPGVSGG